jgi:hypothetical protein
LDRPSHKPSVTFTGHSVMQKHKRRNVGQISRTTMITMVKAVTMGGWNRCCTGEGPAQEVSRRPPCCTLSARQGRYGHPPAARHQCTILLVCLAKTLQISDLSPGGRWIVRTGKTMGIGRQQDPAPYPARSDGWSQGVSLDLGSAPMKTRREKWAIATGAGIRHARLTPKTPPPPSFLVFPPKTPEPCNA